MLKKIAFVFCLSLLVLVLYFKTAAQQSVDICIDWTESVELLERSNLLQSGNQDQFLKQCKNLGVTSVALRYPRLDQIRQKGKIILISNADYQRMEFLGSKQNQLQPQILWIKKSQEGAQNLAWRIAQALMQIDPSLTKNPDDLIQQTDLYYTIKNPFTSWENMLDLRLSVDPELLTLLKQNDLSPVFIYESLDHLPYQQNLFCQENAVWFWDYYPPSDYLARLKKLPTFLTQQKNKTSFVLLEKQSPWIRDYLKQQLDHWQDLNIVRGHFVSEEDIKNTAPKVLTARWLRAAKERSCQFFYYSWNLNLTLQENLENLKTLQKTLVRNKIVIKKLEAPVMDKTAFFSLRIRLVVAWCLAAFSPLLALFLFYRGIKKDQSLTSVILLVIQSAWLCLLAGSVLHFLIPEPFFKNTLSIFPMIKLAMLIPFFASGLVLFSVQEIKSFLNLKPPVWLLLGGVLSIAGLYVFVQRSGNFGLGAPQIELALRYLLEQFMQVRPRFKEVLFGHFWLILGAVFYRYSSTTMAKICLWIGMIGLVSIVNSFCHLHTPLSISILRTVNGLVLGCVLGVGVGAILSRGLKR